MTYVVVLPSIYPPWTNRCITTATALWDVTDHKRMVLVDNTSENRGVAASWNLGVDRMYETDSDWLVIMSAACRFGAPGGADFLMAMHENAGALAVEAAHGIGWHLIAIARSTFDAVGRFDENFWPGYHEDVDLGRRIHLWLGADPPWWPKVSIDVAIAGFAHGIDLGGARVNNDRLEKYYRSKWGGPRGHELWELPFGDRPLTYWPKP